MPSSTWVHTSSVCDLIHKYQPESVLDVGPGFGRWGFLCREILDVFRGRVDKSSWKTKIDAVEVWPRYIREQHNLLYDRVWVACGLRYLRETKERYDMIIAGDVLEHFTKEDGVAFLDEAYKNAKKALIVNVPLGCEYPQGVVKGNEYEEHKSTWEQEEFRSDPRVTRVLVVKERIKQRPYGVILFAK